MNATIRTLAQSLTLGAALLAAASCPADVISEPIASSAQPEDNPNMLIVYDVRDLATMLSPEEGAAGVPMLKDVPLIGNLFRRGAPGGAGETSAEQPTTKRSVINSLAEASSMIIQTISPGILAATGTKDQHDLFQRLITQLRTVDSGSFEIEITVSKAQGEQAPAIGQPFNATGDVERVKQAIRGRAEALIHATESIAYISEWVPVVGNSSVGYQPQTKEVVSGLRLVASVSPATAGRVDLRISGTLDRADVKTTKNAVVAPGNAAVGAGQGVPSDLGIGLPTVQSRSIQCELAVPFEQAIVIAVATGFDSGGPTNAVVIAAKIRQLRPPGVPATPAGEGKGK